MFKMMKHLYLYISFSIFIVIGSVVGDDLPCVARGRPGHTGEGYICVCNSTYCDTVESPERLNQGFYYLYQTSNSTPGFTRTTGGFIRKIIPEGNSNSEVVFVVNASITYQEIIGFGAAVTDSSCGIIKNLPEEAQEKFIESYFGPTGIEYTMLRVPIGGTDFSYRPYTLDDVPYDENLANFSLADEDFNLKIPLIKKAISLSQRDIKLLACTWMAPAWMKDSNSSGPGYIREKYHDVWARYHIRFLEEYQKQGLKVWSLSGGNEGVLMVYLMSLQTPTLNSTYLFAPLQRSWLTNYLEPYLASSNFSDIKFITLEDQRVFAPYWMERMARDPKAYKAIDGIGIHWYTDYFISYSLMDDLHNKYSDKLILYTESSINGRFGKDAVVLGSWYRANGYLYKMFEVNLCELNKNIDHWSNAYLDWNLGLNLDGGPTLSFGVDAAIIVNETSGEFYKQPIFYAMGHFSKFIPPGAIRVQVTSNQNYTATNKDNQLYKKDALREFISFAKLRSGREGSLQGDVPDIWNATVPQVVRCIATTNPDDSFTIMVLNTKNETVNVRIEDSRVGQIALSLNEHSINTFVYWP